MTLVNLVAELEALDLQDNDEQIGVNIVKDAIMYPLVQIANNAGFKGDHVVETVKANADFNYGFDAKT